MLEKLFTTKMSADKKKLQNRFYKIRSKSGKISKIIAMAVFAIIIILIICISSYVAVKKRDNKNDSDIKFTYNGQILSFNNEPYILLSGNESQKQNEKLMAYFPLEELCKKLNSECETNGNKITIKIPGANDNYEIEVNKNQIFYNPVDKGNTGTRETKFSPEIKNNILYIPYEFIEYIWIDANGYDVFGSTLYKNQKLNIKFEIPMNWLGKYFVDEALQNDGYIVFKHTAIAEKYDGAGTLFYIRKKPDSEIDECMNMIGNQTVVWRNQDYGYLIGRPTDVQYPIWADRDKEDINLADEYETMYRNISYIETTFSLINDVDIPYISNAENMSYAEIKDLQRQAGNGHFSWRLDYNQVAQSFLYSKGIDAGNGKITSHKNNENKDEISLIYTVTENEYTKTYSIKLFKPIDKSDNGIWIVKEFKNIANNAA